MVKLFCAIIGNAGGVFEVEVDEKASVSALERAITEHNLKNVNADSLQLFRVKTEGGAWLSSSDDDVVLSMRNGGVPDHVKTLEKLEMNTADRIGDLFGDDPSNNVLVLIPGPDTTRTEQFLQPKWKLNGMSCPVLNFQASDHPFIHIPKEYIEDSGLFGGESGLRLYLRSELKDEWTALNNNIVRSYAMQWIVGPPGTGKSCAAFAFACSLKRGRDWDVLWIHCSSFHCQALSCILFRGDSKKRTCVATPSQIHALLRSLRENAVVFIDGYTKDWDEFFFLDACRIWRSENEEYHRVVVVTTLMSMGKDYQPDSHKVKTNIQSSLESLAISPTTMSEDVPDEMDGEQLFTLTSWTRDDYKKALAYDEFFEYLRPKITTSRGNVKLEERYDLLDTKFFLAGGSARLVFNRSSAEALDSLCSAFSEVSNVVNPVLYWHTNSPCYMSALVVREFAFLLNRQQLVELAKDLAQDPLTDCYLCEMWFFASLLHGGVHCQFYECEQRKSVVWKANWVSPSHFHSVERFDPDGVIPLNRSEQWLVPDQWEYGKYDTVFMKVLDLNISEADTTAKKAGFTQKMLVRFAQVTSSTTHPFKVRFFEDFLTRLVSNFNNWIYAVEVCFVVPITNMNEFRLPMDDNRFGDFLAALIPDLPTTISFKVFGLNYGFYDEQEENVGQKRKLTID